MDWSIGFVLHMEIAILQFMLRAEEQVFKKQFEMQPAYDPSFDYLAEPEVSLFDFVSPICELFKAINNVNRGQIGVKKISSSLFEVKLSHI